MIEIFIAVFAGLFSLVNPFGAIPMFLAMSPHFTQAERNQTSLHASIYFMVILLLFFLAGTTILSFFGISLNSLRIAGGIIIFGSGAQLLRGKRMQSRAINDEVKKEALLKEDISFTPLAMPLLAGPGSISLMIESYYDYTTLIDRGIVIGALVAMSIVVYLVLRASPYLFKILGVAGIRAISRIMGFIVMAIGVELIVSSIKNILI